MTKDANPNAGTTYSLGDNMDRPVDQREIVDNSFLGLVLFGVKPFDDQAILNSIQVGDTAGPSPLLANTKNGQYWRRFTFDGYGEQRDGGDWDLFFDNPQRQTLGRAWPLLAGERGEYELGDPVGVDARGVRAARVVDQGGRADRAAVDRRLPLPEAALRLGRPQRDGTHPAGNAPAGMAPG